MGEFGSLKFLLDTHILIWWLSEQSKLSAEQRKAIGNASADSPLFVSDISLWEVSMLHSLGRIDLLLPLRDWLENAVARPLVERVGISPEIAAEISNLPATFHRDPADRILITFSPI
ncbi:MAG: type II toxin-antitoxin system VapC family toxin [Rhodobacteraceae bacterium]|nr:type II toxin-antitoxin system VapC family toxin [Paracoccaceae bacterium]